MKFTTYYHITSDFERLFFFFEPFGEMKMKILQEIDGCIASGGGNVVTLTYAQSLDGCLCMKRGQPVAISCAESFEMTHRLRALHRSIVVGVGTILADNPSLTCRLVEGTNPQPVVIDSKLRTPLSCKLFMDERCLKPLIICTKDGYDKSKAESLENAGARIVPLESDENGHVNMEMAIRFLGDEFRSVMIEGGAGIISSILGNESTCKLITRIVLTIAPKFLGGYNSIQRGLPEDSLNRWKYEHCEKAGDDMIVSLTLKD